MVQRFHVVKTVLPPQELKVRFHLQPEECIPHTVMMLDHHEAAYSPLVLELEHVSTALIASMPPPRLPVVNPLLPQGGIDESRLRIQSPSRQKETLPVAVRFGRYGRQLPHNVGVELVPHPKQLIWLLELILQCQNLRLHCIANPYERLLGF
jgi:hypothetical protein